MKRVSTAAIVVTFAALVALAWAMANATHTEPNVLIEDSPGDRFVSVVPHFLIDTGGSGGFTGVGIVPNFPNATGGGVAQWGDWPPTRD